MKLFFLFILLINISFFFWEYRKGAPEIYQPQSRVVDTNESLNKPQIFLLSELPPVENNTEQLADIATAVVVAHVDGMPADLELGTTEQTIAESDALLFEANLPALNSDTALSLYLAAEFIPPLDEPHSLSALLSGTSIGANDRQPNKSILLAIDSSIDRFYQHSADSQSLEVIDVAAVENIPVNELQANLIKPPLPEIVSTSTALSTEQQYDMVTTSFDEGAEELFSDSFSVDAPKQNTACYWLQKSQYKKEMLALVSSDNIYKLKFLDQEQEYISSYLVLTNAADSLLAAKERVDSIQSQGINELWLFRQGEFKWRISLGLFSTKIKAIRARNNYGRQITQVLNIVPSVRKKQMTLVTVTTESKFMTDFESKFSVFIDQKVSCVTSE